MMLKKIKYICMYILIIALTCGYIFYPLTAHAATTYVMYGGVNYPVVDGEIILAYIGDVSQTVTHLHTTPSNGLSNDANTKYPTGGGCYNQYYYHSHTDSCYDHVANLYYSYNGGWAGNNNSCGGYTSSCPICGYQEYHIHSHDWSWHADSYVEGTNNPNVDTGHYEYYCGSGTHTIHHTGNKICGMVEGTNYSCNCGLSTSTVVANINARLDETTGEMVFSVKGPSGTIPDYADDVTWTIKAYEMDETTLCETVTLSGDTVRKAIEYPKYSVTCSFKDNNCAVRSFTIPTFIASIYNLYYNPTSTDDANAKALNVYLNGVKLRAVYCNGTNRDHLMFGY